MVCKCFHYKITYTIEMYLSTVLDARNQDGGASIFAFSGSVCLYHVEGLFLKMSSHNLSSVHFILPQCLSRWCPMFVYVDTNQIVLGATPEVSFLT